MAHRVGQSGLTVCSSGNLSVRLDNDEVMISGTGSWVPDLTPDKVSVCRLSTGEVLNGIKPSMESVFHMGVMRERPEVGCVLHFQSPYATAVACMKKRPADFNFTAECPIHVGREIPMIPLPSRLARTGIARHRTDEAPRLRYAAQARTGSVWQRLQPGAGAGHVLRDGMPHSCHQRRQCRSAHS